jgi:L-lactate dehydrogenase complex protein LldG
VSTARDAILGAVRANLRGAARPELPEARTRFALSEAERLTRFCALLERVGARGEVVADARAAARRVAELLAERGVRGLIVSDAPELETLVATLPSGLVRLAPDAPRAALFAADAGLTTAQWGIAETGTLVLEAANERHRLASLLPAFHLALLPRSRLLGTLGEAFARLQAPGGGPRSRTVTFVTGPSRTADIELELVVGVHGPKHLHVLVLEAA